MFKHIIACAIVLALPAHCDALTINAPSSAPSAAPVPHDFVGLGIEGVLLTDYTGNKSNPNTFFANLIRTLSARTGTSIYVRIGGTTLDHSIYNASQAEPIKALGSGSAQDLQYMIGPSWFDAFSQIQDLPFKYAYQVPLGTGQVETVENSVAFAKKGLEAIGLENLYAIEVGNEPNYGPWKNDIQSYVNDFLEYTEAISGNLTSLPKAIYQGLALASETVPAWDVQSVFGYNVDELDNIKSVSHHFYDVYPDESPQYPNLNPSHYLQSTLLNHTFTVARISRFKPAIDFLSAQNPAPLPFYLAEIGSGLGGKNNTATETVQILNSLGTAVWLLDFHLYSMSIGIAAVSNQFGETYWAFAPILSSPTNDTPSAVHATWYGILAAADFLGNQTTKDVRVVEIPIQQQGNANVVAYASFQDEDLASVAILNLDFWAPAVDAGPRPQTTFTLKGIPQTADTVQVRRLTGPGGLDLEGVTWGGEGWSWQNNGMPVQTGNGTEILQVQGGSVDVTVAATEAVVLRVQYFDQ